MYVLKINLQRFGHYLRKPISRWRLLIEAPPVQAGEAGTGTTGGTGAGAAEDHPGEDSLEWNEGNENMYRGILWMKEKYERYREQTDQRYERLREELHRSEQRYQELLQPGGQRQETQPDELGAKQAVINELEEQLRMERLRVEDLILKLQTNGQLLQEIYLELDKTYALQNPSGKWNRRQKE